ncbi:MAG: hypothetical protein PHE68_01690 [Candidatus Peribacteraceae bacterium]|nr:hypothetical protein [Candidatus Peribacteraceae bacterium]MDD5074359.1 hypothetical protein [Candidatus Peribacteraceae bacterium]
MNDSLPAGEHIGDDLAPGQYTAGELAALTTQQLQTTVTLMVHEWMIGNVLPVDPPADADALDKTLQSVTSSRQKIGLIHAIEEKTGLQLDLSASNVLNIQWITDSVVRAIQEATSPDNHE